MVIFYNNGLKLLNCFKMSNFKLNIKSQIYLELASFLDQRMPEEAANKLDTKDKISTTRSNLSSPGILKSNLEERKPSNTVKFSRKDDIRIIGPAIENNKGERKGSANPRRKPSGDVRKQSRELLRRINQAGIVRGSLNYH